MMVIRTRGKSDLDSLRKRYPLVKGGKTVKDIPSNETCAYCGHRILSVDRKCKNCGGKAGQ